MALTQVSTGGIQDGQVQTADIADAQITAAKLHADALDRTYTLGADGSNHYTFTGEGLTGAVNDPTLYLTRGKTYRFVNGNSAGAHPFRIQTTVNGSAGTEYNTGVTNNGGAGGSTIIFEVPHAAPDVLYYQCTSHNAMGGIFYITGALADSGVTTAKIADDAVTSAKIADNTIVSGNLADSAITTSKIAAGAVTGVKIAAEIDNSHITATANIAGSKLADGGITSAKLGASAVTTGKINDLAVTGAKIADTTITSGQLAASSVTTSKINDGAVTDAKIASGISSSKLTGALPAISGAALTGISAGITEFDVWRLTTTNLQGTSSESTISSVSRATDNAYLGSGMTESSGVFTFPSTGYWLIYAQLSAYGVYAYGRARLHVHHSTNSGSSYDTIAVAHCNVSQNGGYGGASTMAIIDVTDTSTNRVRFQQDTSSTSGRYIFGNSSYNATAFTFIRLADT